jgi:outer membrane immunogenic protein
MKRFLLAAIALGGVASPAIAADLGYIEQPLPDTYISPGFSWTGFYAGVNGGYGWGEAETETVGDFDVDGGILGGQIGFNYDLGGFVLGAEADIQWTGMEGGTIAPLGTVVDGNVDYFGTVRARAGYAIDRLLPYVTGGFAYGGASGSSSFAGGFETEETITGWTVGAGAEYALTDNITVKGEYLFTDFGDETFFPGTIIEEDIALSFHTVRAGVNFKF